MITTAIQKKNEENIRKAYKALGDNISCKTGISINDNKQLVHFLREVDIVLCISPKKSYIEIRCKERDTTKYETLGLEKLYYVDETIIEYEDYSDFQASVKKLVVKPINSNYKITIDLKRN